MRVLWIVLGCVAALVLLVVLAVAAAAGIALLTEPG